VECEPNPVIFAHLLECFEPRETREETWSNTWEEIFRANIDCQHIAHVYSQDEVEETSSLSSLFFGSTQDGESSSMSSLQEYHRYQLPACSDPPELLARTSRSNSTTRTILPQQRHGTDFHPLFDDTNFPEKDRLYNCSTWSNLDAQQPQQATQVRVNPEPVETIVKQSLSGIGAQPVATPTVERARRQGALASISPSSPVNVNDMLYTCDQCDFQCSTMDKLKDHENRKHFRRFACGICGREFSLSADLRHHAKALHRQQDDERTALICSNSWGKKGGKPWYRTDNLRRHIESCGKIARVDSL
jgi:hypothetical protein